MDRLEFIDNTFIVRAKINTEIQGESSCIAFAKWLIVSSKVINWLVRLFNFYKNSAK